MSNNTERYPDFDWIDRFFSRINNVTRCVDRAIELAFEDAIRICGSLAGLNARSVLVDAREKKPIFTKDFHEEIQKGILDRRLVALERRPSPQSPLVAAVEALTPRQ